jgi:hypothetical protein
MHVLIGLDGTSFETVDLWSDLTAREAISFIQWRLRLPGTWKLVRQAPTGSCVLEDEHRFFFEEEAEHQYFLVRQAD